MTSSASSIADFAKRLRRDHPLQGKRQWGVHGIGVELASNSAPLLDELGTYYGPLVDGHPQTCDLRILLIETESHHHLDTILAGPSTDGARPSAKETYQDVADGRFLRKRKTGLTLALGTPFQAAVGPCRTNLNQVVNFINHRVMAARLQRGDRLGHAAAVSIHDRGIVLAGASGMGKSTLMLHLVDRGAAFVANDRVLIGKASTGAVIRGIPKWPRVNPGTLMAIPRLHRLLSEEARQTFSALPEDELWPLEDKYDVRIDHCFPEAAIRTAVGLRHLVFLDWSRQSPQTSCTLQPVALGDQPQLLAHLAKSLGTIHNPVYESDVADEPQRKDYLERLQECRTYQLSGSVDMEAAAEQIWNLVDAQSP